MVLANVEMRFPAINLEKKKKVSAFSGFNDCKTFSVLKKIGFLEQMKDQIVIYEFIEKPFLNG